MTRHTSIPALILTVAMAVPAVLWAAQPITADQVARTLGEVGMNARAEQLILPPDIVSTTTSAALKVDSMQVWGDHQIKIRMSCVKPQECLPFFVTLRGNDAQELPPPIAVASSAAIVRPISDSASLVLRTGSHATLLLEGGHVHIQLQVICMQNGAVGQTVRVTSLDHKQTYIAQVTGDNVLRGRL